MQEEINSLKEMGTWDLVKLPNGRKIITCKWVIRKKLDKNGNISKFKARLVARGFSQTPGIDYFNTFSPVMNFN
jgi:hypothetical protein